MPYQSIHSLGCQRHRCVTLKYLYRVMRVNNLKKLFAPFQFKTLNKLFQHVQVMKEPSTTYPYTQERNKGPLLFGRDWQ